MEDCNFQFQQKTTISSGGQSWILASIDTLKKLLEIG